MDKLGTAQLEKLRGQMVATATRKQSLLHREVLLLSEMLDQIIIKAQKEKCASRKT
ncbi:aspartyl-phosphate phosphatase Spo0E family protein [Paenibacillus sp. SYP-B4298]|uniref:aspartyl-phosphate phosphatase Spo0E family protein n=1 Tax=Paenibacillus sp. SYP-B4298 TaxID=2996034 RepID=UPI0022DD0115|nr:aspartyl-phosphate phosphatase Spo0E family protein [Paenibacillus sp. SYP-B4298]